MIAQYDLRELHGLTQKVLACTTAKEVRAILTQYKKTVRVEQNASFAKS